MGVFNFQNLRGPASGIPALLPGQLYYAEDTQVLFIGAFPSGNIAVAGAGAFNPPFANISSGTSTTATMTVGSGATLTFSGTGVVNANELYGVVISGTPPTTGQVLTATSATAANWQTPAADNDSFSVITSGTNSTATMIVGPGAVLTFSGAGSPPFEGEINANFIYGVQVSATPPAAGQALVATSATSANWQTVTTSSSFSAITSGTNTTATMTVGSGASIVTTGTGVVEATQVQAVVVSATPPTTGQVLTATSATAANWQTPSGGGGGGGGVNLQTANYSAVSGDNGKLISFNTPSNVTLTLPNPPPSTTWWVHVENVGTGIVDVSPNGLLIDGSNQAFGSPPTLEFPLLTNEGVYITTDGTNYFTERGRANGGVNAQTGNYAAVSADDGKLISFSSASGLTLTLPAVPPSTDWVIDVQDVGPGNLTINPNGLTLDGSTSNILLTSTPTPSQPAFVRSYTVVDGGSTQTVVTSTVTMNAGDVGILTIYFNNDVPPISVLDSAGNKWFAVPNTTETTSLATGYSFQIWAAALQVGGSVTITVTFPAGSNIFGEITGAEFSGVNTINIIHRSAGQTVTTASPASSPSITTTIPNCVLYGSFITNNGITGGEVGWVSVPTSAETYKYNQYLITSATGTFASTATTTGSQQYGAAIVALAGTSGLSSASSGDTYVLGTQDFANLPNSVANPTAYYGVNVQPATAGTLDDEFDGTFNASRWTSTNFGGSTTATVSNSKLTFNDALQGSGSHTIRYIYQPAPTPPWQITCGPFEFTGVYISNFGGGLVLSDGTKALAFFYQLVAAAETINIYEFTDLNTYSGTSLVSVTGGAIPWWKIRYQSIKYDGTNLFFYLSPDGVNYWQVYEETPALFLVPSRVGIGLYPSTTASAQSGSAFAQTNEMMTVDWFRRIL